MKDSISGSRFRTDLNGDSIVINLRQYIDTIEYLELAFENVGYQKHALTWTIPFDCADFPDLNCIFTINREGLIQLQRPHTYIADLGTVTSLDLTYNAGQIEARLQAIHNKIDIILDALQARFIIEPQTIRITPRTPCSFGLQAEGPVIVTGRATFGLAASYTGPAQFGLSAQGPV